MNPIIISTIIASAGFILTIFSALYLNQQHVNKLMEAFRFEIGAKLDGMERKMDARFAAVDARFETIEARFDAVDQRFDHLEGRIDRLERQFDNFFRLPKVG